MQIAEIFKNYSAFIDQEITVNGWVKTCRDQKQMIFIHLSDGTSQKTLQIVIHPGNVQNFDEVRNITTGTSLCAKGLLIKSPAKEQAVELSASMIKIYQICPGSFPFQKTGLPLDFMRTFPHLRHRSNIMRAVCKCRSVIEQSIHEFLMERNFCLVDLPILTTNACESGCQPLQVTSLLNDGKLSAIPRKIYSQDEYIDDKENGELLTVKHSIETEEIDFKKDFFDNPVYLTVSNQLHLECFALGLGYVYTMTPATRGEPSQTTKHLAHFQMLEYEFCFGTLDDNMNLAESLIKYCASKVMHQCKEELSVLDFAADKKLIPKLESIITKPFIRIEHRDAITLLKEAHTKTPFVDEPQFAGDLSGEQERYLVKHFGHPVIVMRYPKAVKAFYMPVHHTTEGIEYVDCYDMLMDIGEVVGGSQRIWDEKELVDRMKENGMDPKHLDWYVDLRRYGSTPHGGMGLGVERLVATLTGMSNVKDCISFPISVHHCIY